MTNEEFEAEVQKGVDKFLERNKDIFDKENEIERLEWESSVVESHLQRLKGRLQ